jgi:hypothetical protein
LAKLIDSCKSVGKKISLQTAEVKIIVRLGPGSGYPISDTGCRIPDKKTLP